MAQVNRHRHLSESDLRVGEPTERLGKPPTLISYWAGRDPAWVAAS